jgi:hypothetical protein
MRSHSFEALLLALMASLVVIAPSEAIRGSHNQMVAPRRSLQDAAAGTPPAPKEDKADKAEKADKADKADKIDKEAPGPKKDDSTKSSKKDKKDKKACKKATKKDKKNVQDSTAESEVFEGDVANLEYCSQGALSSVQCANLDALPADGKVASVLKLHLVHQDEKQPETITEEAEGILDSGDTKLRFVGCKDMDAPPPPPKKGDAKKTGSFAGQEDDGFRRRARNNHRRKLQTDGDSYEVGYTETNIGVTGVDFNNLKLVHDGTSIQWNLRT